MEMQTIVLSSLKHTWIFDIDGTLVKHNGYIIDGKDTLLSSTKYLFTQIPEGDMIILLTSRTDEYKQLTIDFLHENSIRYNKIIFNVPNGERIIVNDKKPGGLECAVAINFERDDNNFIKIEIDQTI